MTNNEVDSSNRGRYPSTCSIECSQEHFCIDVDKISKIRKATGDGPQQGGSISSLDQIEGQASPYSRSSAKYSSDSLMMPQLRCYDPSRIPASIFGTKPSNPGEWSVASNESLFSLHIANGSLSRENFLTLYKSGEIGRLDEPIKLARHEDQTKHPKTDGEGSSHFQLLPPVTEAENMDKMPEDMEKEAAYHNQEKTLPAENLRTSSRSADSVNSTGSFAFPVFESDDEATNMKIATAESEKQQKARSESQEQQPESKIEQQQQKIPKTSPKAGGSSWFSCFPCLSMLNGKQ